MNRHFFVYLHQTYCCFTMNRLLRYGPFCWVSQMVTLLFFIFSLSLQAATSDEEQQALMLVEQANSYLLSNPKLASYYAQQAVTLIPTNGPSEVRFDALFLYSYAEQLLGNFDLAVRTLYDTERLLPPKDKQRRARLYLLSGRVYGKLGDYNRAIDLNDKATAIFKSMSDSASIAQCYSERGVIHHYINEFSTSDRFFERALTINRQLRNLKEIARCLNNFCLYEGRTDEKIEMLREAITINKNLDARWSLGENYNNLGKQYYYAKRYQESLEALDVARGYADQIGARELISDNYEYRAMVFAAMKRYEQAYHALEEMYRLKGELQNTNRLRSLEQEIAYKQYTEQKSSTERREQEYRIELLKRNVWLLISLMVIGILLSFFYYQRLRRRRKMELVEAQYRLKLSEHELNELKLQRQEAELQSVQSELNDSRREMTNIAVFLQSRSELLDKIREMIKEGYRMDPASLPTHLKKINAFISQSQGGEAASSNLLTTIEDKSKEFQKRLDALHPNLTPGERHLATLLRVNLTTKEIAILTGTTPKTINMNRYRLRKSLGLATDDNLVEYLQKL